MRSVIANKYAAGKKITLQIRGGYFQNSAGVWFVLNPQRGYVPVDPNGRAFRAALAAHAARG